MEIKTLTGKEAQRAFLHAMSDGFDQLGIDDQQSLTDEAIEANQPLSTLIGNQSTHEEVLPSAS